MNETNKNKIKNILVAMGWILAGTAGIVLLVAAVHTKDIKKCKGIEINISGVGNNFFIDKNDVLSIIKRFAGGWPEGKAIENFDLLGIEKALLKDVWIKRANLFFDNNEVLRASIEEREPVARVFVQGGSSFYIDSMVMMLPLSEKFSARLPVFTGFPTDARVLSKADSSLLKGIKTISVQIQNDSFLMAMIDQVDITPQRSFEMIPKIGNQIILFGDASDAAEKFRKLKLLYKNVIVKYGWSRYSSINLEYNNQVVAIVRGKEDIVADSLRTIQLMKIIAASAAKQASDSIRTFLQDNTKNTADSTIIQQSLQRDENSIISNTIEKSSPQEEPIIKKGMPIVKNNSVMKTIIKKEPVKVKARIIMKH